MPIQIDPEQLRAVASACQQDSATLQDQAARMQQHMTQLREALSGIPNLVMADRFDEWNALFQKMSQALNESNSYINRVVQSVDDFAASLGR